MTEYRWVRKPVKVTDLFNGNVTIYPHANLVSDELCTCPANITRCRRSGAILFARYKIEDATFEELNEFLRTAGDETGLH